MADIRTIKKEVKRKNAETGKLEKVIVEYRIDADFVPTNIDDICEEFICEYCSTDKSKQEWLVSQYESTFTYKDKKTGEEKTRIQTFTERRKVFVSQYFPNLSKEKKLSPREAFLQKYGKKKSK